MVQINSDGNKIKENKYKILRMSLLLGNGEDREETVNNFEDAAREIDAMNDEVYLKDLEGKFYDTFKLEDEEKKLSILVDYIGGRVEQRMSLIEDFSNVAGYELVNLPIIKYQDRLDEYKSRLRYIKEYLSNTDRINKLNEEINDLENKLNDAYVKKSKSEEKNGKAEEELFNRFKNIVGNLDLFKDVNVDNIDTKLNEVIAVTADSKKSLDIFYKSFSTLNDAGISGEERNEYLSYVNNAKDIYYTNKEQEYLLRIYSILSVSKTEYEDVISKRNSLNELIFERNNLRKDLDIEESDILSSLYDLLNRQYDEIREEKFNIDNIDNYIQEIESRKIEVSGLEQDNQKVEILSLLKEFCIIDTYDEDVKENNSLEDVDMLSNDDFFSNRKTEIKDEEVVLPEVTNEDKEEEVKVDNKDDIFANIPFADNELAKDVSVEEAKVNEEKIEELHKENVSTDEGKEKVVEKEETNNTLDVEDAKDNQVISIDDATSMNIESATAKSNGVMRRVGEMLGVKVEDKGEEVVVPKEKVEAKEEKEEMKEDTDSIPADIFDNKNYDADPEENSNVLVSNTENPLFNNELKNSTLDEVMANNKDIDNTDNDFWYSNEEDPLDLNSLPDLNSSNNDFFAADNTENNMPSLDFPDMNGMFDEEDK